MSLLRTITHSSLGKKYVMAASGLSLAAFLLAHLAGNSMAFRGQAAYDAYAHHLHALGWPLHLLEGLLALIFLLHILTGLSLFLNNLSARPARYAVPAGQRGLASRTMPYTGLVVLAFLVVHLVNFHFNAEPISTALMVRTALHQPLLASFYLIGLAALSLHMSHGLWSLCQSFGLNHPKYTTLVQIGGVSAAVALGTSFGLLPLLALTCNRFLQ